jgi:hypothetical protein
MGFLPPKGSGKMRIWLPETRGRVTPRSVEREGLAGCAAREQQGRRSVSQSSGERPGHSRDSVRQRERGTQGRVQTCRPPRESAKRARGRGGGYCPRSIGYFLPGKALEHVKHGDRRSDQEHRLFSATRRVAEPVVCRTSWQFPAAFDSRTSMWLTFLRSVAWHIDCFTAPDAVPL